MHSKTCCTATDPCKRCRCGCLPLRTSHWAVKQSLGGRSASRAVRALWRQFGFKSFACLLRDTAPHPGARPYGTGPKEGPARPPHPAQWTFVCERLAAELLAISDSVDGVGHVPDIPFVYPRKRNAPIPGR